MLRVISQKYGHNLQGCILKGEDLTFLLFLNAQSVSINGFSSLFSAICSLMFPSFHVFGTKVRQFPRTAKAHFYQSIILEGVNLPLAKFLSVENNKPLKDLRTGWMIGYQVETFRLCCSLVLLFRQSFISVAGCWSKPSRWIGKGFGAVYSPTEEETAPNGLPPDLFLF